MQLVVIDRILELVHSETDRGHYLVQKVKILWSTGKANFKSVFSLLSEFLVAKRFQEKWKQSVD